MNILQTSSSEVITGLCNSNFPIFSSLNPQLEVWDTNRQPSIHSSQSIYMHLMRWIMLHKSFKAFHCFRILQSFVHLVIEEPWSFLLVARKPKLLVCSYRTLWRVNCVHLAALHQTALYNHFLSWCKHFTSEFSGAARTMHQRIGAQRK